MSTTGIESWAVDLKDVTAIYPFQGTEFLLFLIGMALWILWHIWQIGWEKKYNADKVAKFGDADAIKGALDQD